MSLIVLAISPSLAVAWLAFRRAVFALPVGAAIGTFQHVSSGDARFALSAGAALAAAFALPVIVLLALCFARHLIRQRAAVSSHRFDGETDRGLRAPPPSHALRADDPCCSRAGGEPEARPACRSA